MAEESAIGADVANGPVGFEAHLVDAVATRTSELNRGDLFVSTFQAFAAALEDGLDGLTTATTGEFQNDL
jgi:hypothetical protein